MKPEAGNADDQQHFMAHPEVQAYFRDLFPIVLAESDRGAVLLGASFVDTQLGDLFKVLTPMSTSRRRKSEIFSLNGPFSNFSAKLDVAYVCRILPQSLVEAIHQYRKLRNKLAHKALAFRLKDHVKEIRNIFALLGEGVDSGVTRMAVELLGKDFLRRLADIKDPADEGKPAFESMEAALNYVAEHSAVIDDLEAHQPRWEIGIGIGLIAGVIIHHRDMVATFLGPNDTLVRALRRAHASTL